MEKVNLAMPYKDPKKQKNWRPKVVVIDNTMPDDTTTRENIMRWREEQYQIFLKEKEEANA